jgi:CheY-like chemotaxis protein
MTTTPVMAADAERERLSTLRSYAVLDTGSEPAFDELVRLAAAIFRTSAAAITLVDADRCWFKSRVGLDVSQTPRDYSFCGHAFGSSGTLVVPDALVDDRFKLLPLVTGPARIRFYAGAPLRAPDGHSIGTLCVLDRAPHHPTAEQLAALDRLAGQVMTLFEARRTAPPLTAPSAPVVIAPVTTGSLVLVVDDEDSVRTFTAEVLKHLGHEVFVAANGADALVRIAELRGRVRVVITDMNMPIMGGIDLARSLRKQPSPPAVVVMSGNFDRDSRARLDAEGVTNLLGKPFSMDELRLTLLQAQAALG